jgi:hypothetical protein
MTLFEVINAVFTIKRDDSQVLYNVTTVQQFTVPFINGRTTQFAWRLLKHIAMCTFIGNDKPFLTFGAATQLGAEARAFCLKTKATSCIKRFVLRYVL